ncbi:ATP-binding cassette domain-containing protein [Planctomycetota bacterium]
MAMIEVKNLHKRYGAFEALRGVSFSVEKGEVVGFLGPNGAGKTTTMKILTGFLYATSGKATIGGLCVKEESLEVRRRIGYLPENAPLYTEMAVMEYLKFCADIRHLEPGFAAKRIGEVAERCGITDVMMLPIAELSKGYRQRVGVAQALLHKPELMILDEPTTGLDPNQIVEVRDLLREIGREKTIILSTHILREVEATCNRVLIINQGEIVADAPPAELQRGDTLVVEGRGTTQADAREAFEALPAFRKAEPDEQRDGDGFRLRLRTSGDGEPGVQVFECARDRGWVLSEIRHENPSLEEVFQSLTA